PTNPSFTFPPLISSTVTVNSRPMLPSPPITIDSRSFLDKTNIAEPPYSGQSALPKPKRSRRTGTPIGYSRTSAYSLSSPPSPRSKTESRYDQPSCYLVSLPTTANFRDAGKEKLLNTSPTPQHHIKQYLDSKAVFNFLRWPRQ